MVARGFPLRGCEAAQLEIAGRAGNVAHLAAVVTGPLESEEAARGAEGPHRLRLFLRERSIQARNLHGLDVANDLPHFGAGKGRIEVGRVERFGLATCWGDLRRATSAVAATLAKAAAC